VHSDCDPGISIGPVWRWNAQTLESLYLLAASLLVAGLITWRLLIGSSREKLHEHRSSASVTPLPPKFPAPDTTQYKAVRLQICNRPCAAALELRTRSLLENEAPRLPLSGCDHACSCRYQSLDDRRMGRDRRIPDQVYVKVMGHTAAENRAGRDRRRRGRFQYNGIY
jgi:hypothetical protein